MISVILEIDNERMKFIKIKIESIFKNEMKDINVKELGVHEFDQQIHTSHMTSNIILPSILPLFIDPTSSISTSLTSNLCSTLIPSFQPTITQNLKKLVLQQLNSPQLKMKAKVFWKDWID